MIDSLCASGKVLLGRCQACAWSALKLRLQSAQGQKIQRNMYWLHISPELALIAEEGPVRASSAWQWLDPAVLCCCMPHAAVLLHLLCCALQSVRAAAGTSLAASQACVKALRDRCAQQDVAALLVRTCTLHLYVCHRSCSLR
jgi:hypothetical protein